MLVGIIYGLMDGNIYLGCAYVGGVGISFMEI